MNDMRKYTEAARWTAPSSVDDGMDYGFQEYYARNICITFREPGRYNTISSLTLESKESDLVPDMGLEFAVITNDGLSLEECVHGDMNWAD